MITIKEWLQVCSLLKSNLSVSQIARRINRSVPAVHKLISNGGPKTKVKTTLKVPKKILSHMDYLHFRIQAGVINCSKLYLELKEKGYMGSYNSLYRYTKILSQENTPNIHVQRFETGPGEQAQVDWGTLGKIELDGKRQQLYCFVYVMGYSRAMYAQLTLKQDLQTFQRCHIESFKKLGVPKKILYDNIKTVVIKREKLPGVKDRMHYNLAFLDFAKYYNFEIQLCPPYWPRSKGKVEAGVKYIKSNFIQGVNFDKKFTSLEDLNSQLIAWLNEVANVRIHATTSQRPCDRWEQEKIHLTLIDNLNRYEVAPFCSRNSTQDGMVQYRTNFYSIPAAFSRRKLQIRETNNEGIQGIEIYHEDEIIATHKLSLDRGHWEISDEHMLQKQVIPNHKKSKKPYPDVFTRSLSYYDQLV